MLGGAPLKKSLHWFKKFNKNKNSEPPSNSLMLDLGIYGAIGFQLAASVVGGMLFGAWLDKKIGSTPWGMLIGLSLGCIAGIVSLIRLLDFKNSRQNKSP